MAQPKCSLRQKPPRRDKALNHVGGNNNDAWRFSVSGYTVWGSKCHSSYTFTYYYPLPVLIVCILDVQWQFNDDLDCSK